MKAGLSEMQLGINQEEAQELLGQIAGITYNNLLIATGLLSAQFAELKNITYNFIKLKKTVVDLGMFADTVPQLHEWNKQLCELLALPIFKMTNHVQENRQLLGDVISCREFLQRFYSDVKLDELLEQYKKHEVIKNITETLDTSADVFGRCQRYAQKNKNFTMTKVLTDANASAVFSNFPDLDLALLTSQSQDADNILKQILTQYLTFFQLFVQPMINIEQMVPVIEEQLDKIAQLVPEDRDAIDKMKRSLFLLKDNFGKYYKNMVSSKGSAQTFILDFLYDVYELVKEQDKEDRDKRKASGKKGPSRAKVLQQFTHLSRFIQQNVVSQKEGGVAPQIQSMIDSIQEKIQRLVSTFQSDSDDDEVQQSEE